MDPTELGYFANNHEKKKIIQAERDLKISRNQYRLHLGLKHVMRWVKANLYIFMDGSSQKDSISRNMIDEVKQTKIHWTIKKHKQKQDKKNLKNYVAIRTQRKEKKIKPQLKSLAEGKILVWILVCTIKGFISQTKVTQLKSTLE